MWDHNGKTVAVTGKGAGVFGAVGMQMPGSGQEWGSRTPPRSMACSAPPLLSRARLVRGGRCRLRSSNSARGAGMEGQSLNSNIN